MDSHVPREAYDRFLAVMREPKRLGPLLRRLLELGVLERLIPAFRHARCLLQANNLHKFTVDEHCIYAVQCATELRLATGPPAEAYEQIPDKLSLHLALLLHDLGKGYEEDHSLVGGRIARETTERLGLDGENAEAVEWLVRRHLALSRAALWRDPNDPENVARFVELVPSYELLRMLYVLTCCDMKAVGPGVLTDWKLDMLTHFYRKAAARLNGDRGGEGGNAADELRRQILRKADDAGTPTERVAGQLAALPDSHLASRSAADVAAALARWVQLEKGSVDAAARYRGQTKTIEFTVAVDHGVGTGAFAKLAGTLSGQGLQILSAELSGQDNGLLVIGFETADSHTIGQPDQERIDRICRELRESVHREGPPHLRRLWSDADASRQAALSTLAHRVEFEDAASRHTIVEVYTFDRRGLLYSIAQRIHDLGLTIHAARIATYLDQVVDVFYVTDRQGQKVTDPERLADIRSGLLDVVSRDAEE